VKAVVVDAVVYQVMFAMFGSRRRDLSFVLDGSLLLLSLLPLLLLLLLLLFDIVVDSVVSGVCFKQTNVVVTDFLAIIFLVLYRCFYCSVVVLCALCC